MRCLHAFHIPYKVKYWRILEQSIHLKLFGEVTMIVMILTITKNIKKIRIGFFIIIIDFQFILNGSWNYGLL